jgi:hypothetical protein
MGNSPGSYVLKVNSSNILNIFKEVEGEDQPVPDLQFDALPDSTSIFTFTLEDSVGTFSDSPINPDPGPGSGISPQVDSSGKNLTLTVNPSPNLDFHFVFGFDGITPMQSDPTIVEKPPQPSSSDGQ